METIQEIIDTIKQWPATIWWVMGALFIIPRFWDTPVSYTHLSHGHFKRQVGRLYGQTVRRQSDNGVRQLDHGLIVSVRQPVRYRLIRRHKPPECDSITKPSEIHEVERHNNRHHHRIPECGCELIRLMVRKRVGLQPERHDCHSGGQWQHFIPQLYLYGKLRRKIRPCDNPSGWKARRCNHLRVHIHARIRQR